MLLWLWWRLATAALMRPLAWEFPYAVGTALKRKKKKVLRWALTQEDWYPCLEDTWTDRHRGTTMWKQREKSPLTHEGQRPQKEPTLDLGLLVSRIVRK